MPIFHIVLTGDFLDASGEIAIGGVLLGTVAFGLRWFGIQFVASPRHADGVVVTGPVSSSRAARRTR